jgi:hypothetical protein
MFKKVTDPPPTASCPGASWGVLENSMQLWVPESNHNNIVNLAQVTAMTRFGPKVVDPIWSIFFPESNCFTER